MRPTLALASIDAVAAPHRHGHRCDDGKWYNPGVGTRTSCAVLGHLRTAAEQVERLHAQVHEAAHDNGTVRLVMQGMTGFTDDDLTAMGADDAEGWMQATRLAIEELAHQLDRDPVLEARAAAVKARLEAAGLRVDEPSGTGLDQHFHGCPEPTGRPFDCDWCQERSRSMEGV